MADRSKQSEGTHEFYSATGSAAPPPLASGALLKDRYRIERELGRGGIGVVYLGRDERLHGMPVVIKFLLDDSGQSAWLAKKFMQEAEALTRINHPGIVRVIDRDRAEDGKPFFVMEFIKGKPLRSVMNAEGMDFEYVAVLIRQIGAALSAAHREGIFHRDLKPENIMLETLSSGDEQIKLIDFGIAKVRDSQAGATTENGLIAGSLNYIAPEQLTGETVGPASDIYALAIVVYEMVSGRRPFNPDSPNTAVAVHQLMVMQQGEQVVPPKRLRPSLPESAQTVILNALAWEASRRPQDARVFSDQMANALTDATASFAPTVLGATQAVGERSSLAIQPPQTLPHAARETRPDVAVPQVAEPPKSQRPVAKIVAGVAVALIALILIGVLAGKLFRSKSGEPSSTDHSPSAAASDASANAIPERVLNYAILMQKDPRRYPGSKPFQLPGEVVFSPGDRVRLSIESSRAGYLYVIDRELYDDGTTSEPYLIFPTLRLHGGNNTVAAGKVIEFPEQSAFRLKPMRPDYKGESLTLIVTTEPLAEITVGPRLQKLDGRQVEQWERQWSAAVERFEMVGGAGKTYTRTEKAAGAEGRLLTQEDELPQTLYRMTPRPGSPLLISIPLRIGK